MADLVFGRPPYAGGPVHLVFGETATPPVILPTSVVGVVTLGGVSVSGSVVVSDPPAPCAVVGAVSLGGVVVSGVALYLNRNPRRASTRATMPHQVATQRPGATSSGWRQGERTIVQPVGFWQLAEPTQIEPMAVWQPSSKVGTAPATLWGTGAARAHQAAMAHQVALFRRSEAMAAWEIGKTRAMQAALVHQVARSLVRQVLAPWQQAQARQVTTLARSGKGVARLSELLALWETARPVPPGLELWPPVRPVVPPRVPSTHLVFSCPPWAGGAVHLVFGRLCGMRAHVAIPIQRTYVTINSIVLRRVSGDIPIPAEAFSMSLDADSWTWSWSATVRRESLELVRPGSYGDPVEVEAVVNGIPYRLYSESVGSQRQFGSDRISVKGRGKAAVLDAPYAPVLSFSNTADRTAQQLMNDVLTINGASIGWDVDFGLTDWLVPADVWAHQGAYITAINQIAMAAGGYVQPHSTAQTLRILPRYPTAPWEWGDLTPDFQLPSSVTEVEGIEWARKTPYNRVFVSGSAGGILGEVTRAGTAGDVVAPMVTDSLITHADAARQRGLSILSDTGHQARVTLTLPVLEATGIIKPGQTVRYVDSSQSRIGIVRSTSVSWSLPRLRQTIEVETHV